MATNGNGRERGRGCAGRQAIALAERVLLGHYVRDRRALRDGPNAVAAGSVRWLAFRKQSRSIHVLEEKTVSQNAFLYRASAVHSISALAAGFLQLVVSQIIDKV